MRQLFFILSVRAACTSACLAVIVSTSRCGRDNPGSNPGHGKAHRGLHGFLLTDFLIHFFAPKKLPF